jgi:hypothetical protein
MTAMGPLGEPSGRPVGPTPSDLPSEPPGPGVAAELSAKAADTVDLIVETIHDKALRPLLLAARAVVFGLLAAVLGLVVLVLVAVALVRLFDVYVFDGRVWASDALLGSVFVAAGVLAWSRRTGRSASTEG